MRDWAIWQARAGCYSQAAVSSNDSKTRYDMYLQVEDAAEHGVRDVHAVDVVVGVGGVDEGVAHGHRLLLDALWRQLLVLQDDPPLQPLRRRQLRLRLVQRRREQRVAEYLLQCRILNILGYVPENIWYLNKPLNTVYTGQLVLVDRSCSCRTWKMAAILRCWTSEQWSSMERTTG